MIRFPAIAAVMAGALPLLSSHAHGQDFDSVPEPWPTSKKKAAPAKKELKPLPQSAPATQSTPATQELVLEEKQGEEQPPKRFSMEYVGIRAYVGGILFPVASEGLAVIGAELSLITLRWQYIYLEAARIGVGVPLEGGEAAVVWGTAVGVRYVFEGSGRHEIRLGVHLTAVRYYPSFSGMMFSYLLRARSGVAVEVSLFQTSFPFGGGVMLGLRR